MEVCTNMSWPDALAFIVLLVCGVAVILGPMVLLGGRGRSVEPLLSELKECARVFEHYADLHAAKGTADGDIKAKRNLAQADIVRRAVREWEG